jgi:general secretion pathway protein C
MLRRFIWLRNLLFLVGLSFLCSKILQAAILANLSSQGPSLYPTQARPQTETSETDTPPLDAYTLISRKNIFNSEQGKKEEPVVAEEEPIEESTLDVVLLGTAIGPPEDTFAVIEDPTTREQDLYQVGDTVHGEARITKVARCRIVLQRDGGKEVLECIEPDERRRPASRRRFSRRSARPSGKGIKRVSSYKYLIDEERVDSALANVNKLMTQIRVVPHFKKGGPQGYRVFAVKPHSLFAKLGLRNGDIVQSINGREILTPGDAYQAYQELRNTRNLDLQIVRSGVRRTLDYEIR